MVANGGKTYLAGEKGCHVGNDGARNGNDSSSSYCASALQANFIDQLQLATMARHFNAVLSYLYTIVGIVPHHWKRLLRRGRNLRRISIEHKTERRASRVPRPRKVVSLCWQDMNAAQLSSYTPEAP
jgi:hypothetical protein